MGFSWLKNLGEAVKVGSSIVTGYGPLIAALIPGHKDDVVIAKVSDTLGDVGEVVKNAEIFGAALNLQGDAKLTAAIPAVAQVILRSSIMAGKPPRDQALFMDGVKDIASGMAKLFNSRGD